MCGTKLRMLRRRTDHYEDSWTYDTRKTAQGEKQTNKQETPGNRADGRELTLVNDRKEENTSKNLGKRELEKQKENQGQAKKLEIFVIVYSKIRKCYWEIYVFFKKLYKIIGVIH